MMGQERTPQLVNIVAFVKQRSLPPDIIPRLRVNQHFFAVVVRQGLLVWKPMDRLSTYPFK